MLFNFNNYMERNFYLPSNLAGLFFPPVAKKLEAYYLVLWREALMEGACTA
jgi:hypothetical protein